MIAMTLRRVIYVLMLVMMMVRFVGAIVAMDVRVVSSAMTMVDYAHDIDRIRSNRKW